MQTSVTIRTTWGSIQVDQLNGSVTACHLPFLSEQPDRPFDIEACENDAVSQFVAASLTGKATPCPALKHPEGTDFQQRVWRGIRQIPRGHTQTYGELAQAIGHPRAYRAVANACGRNPLSIFIPCHRVVAAGGHLGGFTAGLPWKIQLLKAENISIPSL